VPLCDFIDGEHRSCPDRVSQEQQNGQRDQSIEPRPESLLVDEVKRCQHPYIDVRKAIRREYDIADDGQYLQRHAPARVCKILQGAANNSVAQKRKKPPVEGLCCSGDDPFFRKWMENTRKVGLNSHKQAFGGTDRAHVSSLPVDNQTAMCGSGHFTRFFMRYARSALISQIFFGVPLNCAVSPPLNERSQERQARPLVVGCSTETGSDAGKVFLRASSSASSWRLRLSLSPSS
jgi:hypothetical protein